MRSWTRGCRSVRVVRAIWGYLRGEPFAAVGVSVYVCIVLVAVFAERLAPHDPRAILRVGRRVARYLPMTPENWLGTTSSLSPPLARSFSFAYHSSSRSNGSAPAAASFPSPTRFRVVPKAVPDTRCRRT